MMGYDEHYSGSQEAGSVASLSWVKEGVANTLKEVPADQFILGMPFYTRIWALTPKDKEAAETTFDLSSKIYGMKAADDQLTINGATKTWLADCGQNYSEFQADGVTYKVWLEDAQSAEARLKVVEENNLAGAAFWKLGMETSSVWDTIIKYIH